MMRIGPSGKFCPPLRIAPGMADIWLLETDTRTPVTPEEHAYLQWSLESVNDWVKFTTTVPGSVAKVGNPEVLGIQLPQS